MHGQDKVDGIAINRFGTLFLAGTQQLNEEFRSLSLARFTSAGKFLGVRLSANFAHDIHATSLALSENGKRIALAGEFTHEDGAVVIECLVFDEQGSIRWKPKPVTPAPYRSNSAPRVSMDRYGGMVMVSQLNRGTQLTPSTDGDYLVSCFGPDGSLRETQLYNSSNDANDHLSALAIMPDSSLVIVGQRSTSNFAYLQALNLRSLSHP